MEPNALKEHYEDRLGRVSRRIEELERERREAGTDAGEEMARALQDLKKQRDELSQTVDRFDPGSRHAVDDLTQAVDTALGNLEERLRQMGPDER